MAERDLLAKYQTDVQEVPYSEEDEQEEVRQRGIKWDSKGEAFISKKEIIKMQELDSKSADKLQVFESDGNGYASIFMSLLSKMTNMEDIRYVITLIEDIFELAANSKGKIDLQTVLSHFYHLQKAKPDPSIPAPPFGPLLKVINLNRKPIDFYVLSLGSRILVNLIKHYPGGEAPKDIVEDVITWFVELLEMNDRDEPQKLTQRRLSLGLVGLRPLLSKNEYRALFASDAVGGLPILMQLSTFEARSAEVPFAGSGLKKKKTTTSDRPEEKRTPNFQQIYDAGFCLWILSFNSEVQQRLTDPKLLSNLCLIVKRCNKVKAIRISLAVLRNLLGIGKNNEKMISYGLLSSLALLKQKRWGDEELEGDISAIEEALAKNVDDLTSWDRYKNEVLATHLEWSPPHKSAKFWQENYLKFEEENYFLLGALKSILEQSADPNVKAIACWDIGEFVRVHPSGKRICQSLNLKEPVMKQLDAAKDDPTNEDLQKLAKEALTALQKLMITNWEYLQ